MKKILLFALLFQTNLSFADNNGEHLNNYEIERYISWLSSQYGLINYVKNDVCGKYNIKSKAFDSLLSKKEIAIKKGGTFKDTWVKNESMATEQFGETIKNSYQKEGKHYCLNFVKILDTKYFEEKEKFKPKH